MSKDEEILEGVLDAAFRGDNEDFAVFNEEWDRRQESLPEGKFKVSFGSGSERVDKDIYCPDCKSISHISGIRFITEFDDELDEDKLELGVHRLRDCPMWRKRIVFQKWMSRNFIWRFVFRGYGRWNRVGWKVIWKLQWFIKPFESNAKKI